MPAHVSYLAYPGSPIAYPGLLYPAQSEDMIFVDGGVEQSGSWQHFLREAPGAPQEGAHEGIEVGRPRVL